MTQTEQTQGSFNGLGIANNLLAILAQKGFHTPTPIQHQVIPEALNGKDVVGIAQTGTGKTLAFGIPMIQRLSRNKGQGLILAPTRELALQIEQSLKQIGTPLGLRCVAVIGGTSQSKQVSGLRNNPHIVIATPGRLVDLMNQGIYKLKFVNTVVLDEGDRMLDMGFLPPIRRILGEIPKGRQTMLFSATMPKTISALASEFMQLPIRIEIAPQGTSSENTEQEIFIVKKMIKCACLILYYSKTETVWSLFFHEPNTARKESPVMSVIWDIHQPKSIPIVLNLKEKLPWMALKTENSVLWSRLISLPAELM